MSHFQQIVETDRVDEIPVIKTNLGTLFYFISHKLYFLTIHKSSSESLRVILDAALMLVKNMYPETGYTYGSNQ